MTDFYDQLAPFYHLVHQDWNASICRQGEQLSSIIESEWPSSKKVLDVSCGIGTQAIALAQRGYSVSASDLSEREIERARLEAKSRSAKADFSVCDMRNAHGHHGSGFDVVVSIDNSIPHLLTDEDILLALKQMTACLLPGGGCLITIRDYEREARGTNLVKPYGTRVENGSRYLLFQVWDFEDAQYDLTFFFVEENLSTQVVKTHAMRSKYYAISTSRLCELMQEAGLRNVRRLDGVFYQPVLLGTRAA
ncbi:MAG: class I SAM-dependent methyltransferase [Burkholderiales bacterium]|nr:class I SAM-dependent methyltransferase [Burkholderiales bacterium]